MKREDATNRAKRHVLAMKISSIFLPAIALTALVCGNAHASTDACQPIRNAIDQQNEAQQMQVSAAVTYIDSGRSYYYDTLYSGSKVYSRNRNGPWEVGMRRIVPVIVDGRPAIYDCRFVGTDHIGSATVMAYTYRRFIPDHTMDVRALIDAADGKFLQTEIVFGPFPDHKTKYNFSYGPNPPLPTVDERTLWHPPH